MMRILLIVFCLWSTLHVYAQKNKIVGIRAGIGTASFKGNKVANWLLTDAGTRANNINLSSESGMNQSPINGAGFEERYGVSIAVSGSVDFNRYLSILSELNYTQKGVKMTYDIQRQETYRYQAEKEYRYNFITLPILAKIGVKLKGIKPYGFIGPVASLNIKSSTLHSSINYELNDEFKEELENNGFSIADKEKEKISGIHIMDFGLVVGGGVEFWMKNKWYIQFDHRLNVSFVEAYGSNWPQKSIPVYHKAFFTSLGVGVKL